MADQHERVRAAELNIGWCRDREVQPSVDRSVAYGREVNHRRVEAIEAALRDERRDASGARSGNLTRRIRSKGSKRRRAIEQGRGGRADRVRCESETEQDDVTSAHALRWSWQAERDTEKITGAYRIGGSWPHASAESEQ
jgi:hypothetical protein